MDKQIIISVCSKTIGKYNKRNIGTKRIRIHILIIENSNPNEILFGYMIILLQQLIRIPFDDL